MMHRQRYLMCGHPVNMVSTLLFVPTSLWIFTNAYTLGNNNPIAREDPNMSTYAETAARLEAARNAGIAEITVELDAGVVTMATSEAIETFEEIEPGEAFEIVSIGGHTTPNARQVARATTANLVALLDSDDEELAELAADELDLRDDVAPHDEAVGVDLPTYSA